jgi:hypothetical protein
MLSASAMKNEWYSQTPVPLHLWEWPYVW